MFIPNVIMYKNLILNLLFLSKVIYGQNFIPEPRVGQAAVPIRDRIYYIGGGSLSNGSSNFFYLESNKAWVDLTTQGVNLPPKVFHTADVGGTNQDLIFIVGGQLEEQNLVYQFDTKTNTITTPLIQGKIPPTGRAFMNSVSYKGKIYIFSGLMVIDSHDTFYNGFDILDTINLSWGTGNLEGAPIPRYGYTATLVNGVIYYIGGLAESLGYDPLSNVRKLIINLIINL
jgi:hypothetical protein